MSNNIYEYNPDDYVVRGTVKVYNKPKEDRKYKLNEKEKMRLRIIIATGLVAVLAAGATILKVDKPIVIPEGKVSYFADYKVSANDDSWREVAKRFYDEEEKAVYGSLGKYRDEVKDGELRSGTVVQVPNIIDADNPLYVRLTSVESQLDQVKNNMWQTYNVAPGEDLYGICEKLVADVNQIQECMLMIKSKNSIDKILPTGEIAVPNPLYFSLMSEYESVKQELDNSLNNSIKH